MEYPKEGVIWPVVVDVAKPFYEGMQNHQVLIQQCQSCETYLPPAQAVCDECGSDKLEWLESTGEGEIYSYVVFHRSFHPYFDDKIPYTVVLIELDEGPRVMGHLEFGSNQKYKVGSKVVASFKTIDEKNELLFFKLEGGES